MSVNLGTSVSLGISVNRDFAVGRDGVYERHPSGLPLDGLSVTALAAWDMFNLTSDYAGPNFRLRETSTNGEDDFTDAGATGNPLNGLGQTVAEWLTAQGAASAAITTIYDQIGANNLVQATAGNQPTYSATGFNGLPTGEFDGINDFMAANGISSSFTGVDQPATVITPYKFDVAGSAEAIWSFARLTSDTPVFYLRKFIDELYQITRRDDASTIKNPFSTQADDKQPHISTTVFPGTTVTIYVDGVVTSISGTDLDVGSITLDNFSVGALVRTSVQLHMQGDLSGGIVFDQAIGDADRTALESRYLRDKGF